MTEVNPALVIEGGSHDSHLLRQLWGDTYTAGIVAADHLEVTEQGTPALGVTVAAGRAFVEGDEASDQGLYYVSNDDDHDVALATADATNDRIDLIVARILDSFYSGGDDEWELQAVTGTPAASPSAPSAPSNSLILAEVTVPADAGGNPAITDSDIEDQRVQARAGGVAPGGVLGYAEITGSQTGITSEADITGLSVTFTVPAGRLTRLSFMGRTSGSSADNEIGVRFRDGSDTLLASGPNTHDQGRTQALTVQRVIELSSGEHTIRVSGQLTNGSGSVEVIASTGYPTGFLAEDIGPA